MGMQGAVARLARIGLCAALMAAVAPAARAEPVDAGADAAAHVDARFDRTGDGIVDAADWRKMSAAEQRAYAWAALAALGEDPYTRIEGETTRGDRFLAGLRAVYGGESPPRASGRHR